MQYCVHRYQELLSLSVEAVQVHPVCRRLFFFQAEDGIRDLYVTGVQTCALPICSRCAFSSVVAGYSVVDVARTASTVAKPWMIRSGDSGRRWRLSVSPMARYSALWRSEERRVGKECRSRWSR